MQPTDLVSGLLDSAKVLELSRNASKLNSQLINILWTNDIDESTIAELLDKGIGTTRNTANLHQVLFSWIIAK